ncbi:MAG: methylenetetrahydrofolate--tRNA-(uracil(54)-C(5))-methyltransferase (FADH(2)-oxidizing) TrmFO [Proteobacteria bacterium]|jgi:methylenetetrahydrofolate--tRNA-(uracil-5-)-methyltransferase|nr:methylenetetrahydrofolate--tRNA-(uracil(54)-C(5))-methyltransferase (FADH(2)-oxidizing) TrmFO [Pseudomonadota bacterium]MDA1135929.1 methylenetetrahydrofolate--tRNA-(uracil(54)-C(5))-methyltransferase (FADH(2)-oxidizing) TrmFO [Pseudomonadota bacterium]
MNNLKKINIIGGGLAGCEAAYQISKFGIKVHLYEMRPKVQTEAHKTNFLAELVCSNSFRSDDKEYNAVGVLHEELRIADSLIMKIADLNKVPAGSALAVDREGFAKNVHNEITKNENITIINEEIQSLDRFNDELVIVATGPLTSNKLTEFIKNKTEEKSLAFYDAIAPIVYKDSINMKIAWKQSRYDKGEGDDYINCPLSKDEYYTFINSIIAAPKMEFKEFEKTPFFEGCMPIEEIVRRGPETLRFGPMKPVGLTNPHKKEEPYAIVQLRQDNLSGSLYNIVGFQTKMKHGAQKDVFKLIPGLERSEFARLGGLHRNTFINSPKILDTYLRLKSSPNIIFAGQITGVEGYVESSAIGFISGLVAVFDFNNMKLNLPPETSAHGSLLKHITLNANPETFQPMNINFGLMPDINHDELVSEKKKKYIKGREKKKLQAIRALKTFKDWHSENINEKIN